MSSSKDNSKLEDFVELLEHVAAQITPKQFRAIKRLCRDKIPDGHLSEMDEAGDVFVALQDNAKISPKDTTFLVHLLTHASVGRKTLADQVTYFAESRNEKAATSAADRNTRKRSADDLSDHPLPKKGKVSSFRKLLKDISDDICPDEVEEMKNLLLGKQLKRKDKNMVTNGMELLLYLEFAGHISDTNVDLLKDLFKSINRQPLIDKLRIVRH